MGMAAPLIERQAPTVPTLPKSISSFFFFFFLRYIHKPSLESEAIISPMKERLVALHSFISPGECYSQN